MRFKGITNFLVVKMYFQLGLKIVYERNVSVSLCIISLSHTPSPIRIY